MLNGSKGDRSVNSGCQMRYELETQPTITVMMPCYNNQGFLLEAIRSVLLQQVDCTMELLIIDDASTDQSVEVIESFEDSRIRLIRNPANRGIAAVRNLLLEHASGKYVTSLDGDDLYVSPTKLASELAIIRQFPDSMPVVAYSDVETLGENQQRINVASEVLPPHEGLIFQGLFDRRIMIPRDFLVSADIARQAGGFDETLSLYEDWDYKLRLARRANFHFTGQVGIGYRRHGRGLSAARGRFHRQQISRIRRKYGIEGFGGDPMNLMACATQMSRLARMLTRNRAA